jgi:hypothetical protein
MKVYIAGPYTHGDVARNVRAAIDAAHAIREAGHTPFLPHLSHFWHMIHPRAYEDWLAMDLEWLPYCEALVYLPGHSPGTNREIARAFTQGIRCLTLDDFLAQYSVTNSDANGAHS